VTVIPTKSKGKD